jgi:REP element-mobilizing transposase RayT
MPRGARTQSATAVYHVMLRGINQTQLFYEDADRIAFLERLKRFKDQCQFDLYAYCLMGNHVHLVIKENDIDLSLIIKKITLSYSHWFNAKYDRSGYLFQGRYKRESVTTDEYLLAAIRYIHNNPVKIGEAITHWTSYDDYLKSSDIADTDFVLAMFDSDPAAARKQFAAFNKAKPETDFAIMDLDASTKIKDADAIKLIKEIANLSSCQDMASVEKDERNRILGLLKSQGLSVRQISRLTGLNRGMIQRASK